MRITKFSERLKERMSEIGITAAELSRKLHLNEAVISQYKSGKYEPKQDRLEEFAKILGVNESWLMGYDTDKKPYEKNNDLIVDKVMKVLDNPQHTKRKKGVRIPVYGNVAAGVPILAIENFDSDDPDDWEEISEKMASTGDFIALRIHGDSMEPRMQEGDVVIVRLQPDIETGDTAIVRINGDEATCKKIKKTPEGLMLISTNPAYEPMFYTPKDIETLPVAIIGKVVELRAKF